MNRVVRITHWIATSIVSLLTLASATTYIIGYDEVRITFMEQLGFPAWLIYPLSVAQFSSVLMLITKFNRTLTEWAYAGLVFNLLLAIGAHVAASDQQVFPVSVVFILTMLSYFTWKRMSTQIDLDE